MKSEHKEPLEYVRLALSKLLFWRRDPPVDSICSLSEFIETRSKFIAQTTLYGYLRTRAGTRYPSLFEDELFVKSLNIAKWEIYLACLADLTVYTGVLLSRKSDARPDEISALCCHMVTGILEREEVPEEQPEGFAEVLERINARISKVDWHATEDGEAPFDNSINALVEWAPVAPQLKEYDTAIVINSMRFKWKGVRDQVRPRLDGGAVIIDWRAQADLLPGAGLLPGTDLLPGADLSRGSSGDNDTGNAEETQPVLTATPGGGEDEPVPPEKKSA